MGCTSLTEIVLPNSVTWLGGSVFHDCAALTHVTLSNQITELYDMLFYGCSALEQITVPESVVSWRKLPPSAPISGASILKVPRPIPLLKSSAWIHLVS